MTDMDMRGNTAFRLQNCLYSVSRTVRRSTVPFESGLRAGVWWHSDGDADVMARFDAMLAEVQQSRAWRAPRVPLEDARTGGGGAWDTGTPRGWDNWTALRELIDLNAGEL